MINRQHMTHILLRLSLSVILIGIGLWEMVQPQYWSSFVPAFLSRLVNANLFTQFHGLALLVLGIAVLLGIYLRVAAALSALMVIAILASLQISFGFTDLIIRDLSVLLIALALCFDDTDYLRLVK